MGHQLSDIGEEWFNENGWPGASLIILLYDDSTDTIAETDDVAAVTTEPSDGNYTRQTYSVASGDVKDLSGDWGLDVPEQSFDMGGTTGTVDSWMILINFDSDEAGDGGTAADHYILNGQLSQAYDLSNISGFLNVDNIGGTVT